MITEWRHTAEVHADPELFAALTAEGEDQQVRAAEHDRRNGRTVRVLVSWYPVVILAG